MILDFNFVLVFAQTNKLIKSELYIKKNLTRETEKKIQKRANESLKMPQIGINTYEGTNMQNLTLQQVNVNTTDDDVIGSDETPGNQENNFRNAQLVLKDVLNRSSSLTDENKNDEECKESNEYVNTLNQEANYAHSNSNLNKSDAVSDKKRSSKKSNSRSHTEINQPNQIPRHVKLFLLIKHKKNLIIFK